MRVKSIPNMSFLLDEELIEAIYRYASIARMYRGRSIFDLIESSADKDAKLTKKANKNKLAGEWQGKGKEKIEEDFDEYALDISQVREEYRGKEIVLLNEIIHLISSRLSRKENLNKVISPNDYVNFLRWWYLDISRRLTKLKKYNIAQDILHESIKKWETLFGIYLDEKFDTDFKNLISTEFDNNIRLALKDIKRSPEKTFTLLDTALERMENIFVQVQKNQWIDWFIMNETKLENYFDGLEVKVINAGLVCQHEVQLKERIEKTKEILEELKIPAYCRKQFDTIQRNFIGLLVQSKQFNFTEKILQKLIGEAEEQIRILNEDLKRNKENKLRELQVISNNENSWLYKFCKKISGFWGKYGDKTGFFMLIASSIVGWGIMCFVFPPAAILPVLLAATGASVVVVGMLVSTFFIEMAALEAGSKVKTIENCIASAKENLVILDKEEKNIEKKSKEENKVVEKLREKLNKIQQEKGLLEIERKKIEKKLTELDLKYEALKKERLNFLNQRRKNEVNKRNDEVEQLKRQLEEAKYRKQLEEISIEKTELKSELNLVEKKNQLFEKKINLINAKIITELEKIVSSRSSYAENREQCRAIVQQLKVIDETRQNSLDENRMTRQKIKNYLKQLTPLVNKISGFLGLTEKFSQKTDTKELKSALAELQQINKQLTYQDESIQSQATLEQKQLLDSTTPIINSEKTISLSKSPGYFQEKTNHEERVKKLKEILHDILLEEYPFTLSRNEDIIQVQLIIEQRPDLKSFIVKGIMKEIRSGLKNFLGEFGIEAMRVNDNILTITTASEQKAIAIQQLLEEIGLSIEITINQENFLEI